MKKFLLPIAVVCLAAGMTYAQDPMRTTALNIFKNGTYFIVKEGSLPLNNSKAQLQIPKAPLLGTFWMTTSKDLAINRVLFSTDTIKTTRQAKTLIDLIQSNKGKKVKLLYRVDEKTTTEISGTLLDYISMSGIVKIKTNDGKYGYFASSDIRQLFVEENPNESLKADSTSYLATIEFNRDPKEARLKLVYMQAGIQWIPTYNIKVLNDKDLQLEMRALVENFAENIKDAELSLTVGDPNYKYGRSIEPFASPYLTNLLGASPTYGARAYQFQNKGAAMQGYAPMAQIESADVGYSDYSEYTTAGEKTGDLYMYRVGKVTVPMNSKASFQVFSQKITYKDVYKVQIGDVVNFASTLYVNNNPEQRFDVYHSMKLINSTKNPFTTAPVFVMNEDLEPLAQDEITYTPIGGNVSVQLSKSPDITIKNNEEEKDRQERARTYNKAVYHKVIISGSVEINNLQDKDVTLNVTKYVNALVTTASDNGTITKPPKFQGLNPNSMIEWELPIKANEKKTLTYFYEVYVYAQ
jgi:hypothetical protein